MKSEIDSAEVLSYYQDAGLRQNYEDHQLLGGQAEWAWAVPALFQRLQNPMLWAVRPALHGSDRLFSACAYWTPLLYQLVYSFGWRDPGKGLLRWIAEDFPDTDPRLRLMHEVWARGADLRRVALEARLLDVGQPLERYACSPWELTVEERRSVENELTSIRDVVIDAGGDPMEGSIHQLHFNNGGHIREAAEGAEPESLLVTDQPNHRALVVVDSLVGWYGALSSSSRGLPDAGSRSWRVEVYCRPVGSLGVFRRSRQTGIWFSGQHRYHEWGNI
jgi:hypothetical protein